MLLRLIVGLIKGGVVGAGIGFGAWKLGLIEGVFAYLACAVAGALVGVVAGRAPWRAETIWTPVLKLLVGGGIGAGLCALGVRVMPDMQIASGMSLRSAPILATVVGVLYGIFVEIDDGSKPAEAAPPAKK